MKHVSEAVTVAVAEGAKPMATLAPNCGGGGVTKLGIAPLRHRCRQSSAQRPVWHSAAGQSRFVHLV